MRLIPNFAIDIRMLRAQNPNFMSITPNLGHKLQIFDMYMTFVDHFKISCADVAGFVLQNQRLPEPITAKGRRFL